MKESFLNGRVELWAGDCLDVLARLEECSIDAVVTDPPYHLQSIHKRFAAKGRDETSERYAAGPYGRTAKGFMGKQWDGGDIAFRPETWAAVYRALKPGAYLLAFSGTRTYHRMVCAIEDAGFEVRDMVSWVFGSGFPKSHDVSKAIDKAAGAEREVVGRGVSGRNSLMGGLAGTEGEYGHDITAPATPAAREWQGWGTALKPALEPICMARKPLSEPTIAANVLKWGTGALNIDGCRVENGEAWASSGALSGGNSVHDYGDGLNNAGRSSSHSNGRWPANVIHDGSDEVVGAFPESESSAAREFKPMKRQDNEVYGKGLGTISPENTYSDSGSAARYFYTAKADADDRLGSKHPTVKPLDLMQYLVRLVTPPGGLILDPFAGTGTTGEAAFREGMRAILIEREEEYQNDIRRRMKLVLGGPEERARESIKAKLQGKPIDNGPLFAGAAE